MFMLLTRATHETIVYLHDFPCGAPGDNVQTGVGPNLQLCLERMIRHRDLAGEYDWIAVDCDKKGAPMPVFVQPRWLDTRTLVTLVAEAAQWTLDIRRAQIAAASGQGDTDDVTSVLRNFPTSKLVTEDLDGEATNLPSPMGRPHL